MLVQALLPLAQFASAKARTHVVHTDACAEDTSSMRTCELQSHSPHLPEKSVRKSAVTESIISSLNGPCSGSLCTALHRAASVSSSTRSNPLDNVAATYRKEDAELDDQIHLCIMTVRSVHTSARVSLAGDRVARPRLNSVVPCNDDVVEDIGRVLVVAIRARR